MATTFRSFKKHEIFIRSAAKFILFELLAHDKALSFFRYCADFLSREFFLRSTIVLQVLFLHFLIAVHSSTLRVQTLMCVSAIQTFMRYGIPATTATTHNPDPTLSERTEKSFSRFFALLCIKYIAVVCRLSSSMTMYVRGDA